MGGWVVEWVGGWCGVAWCVGCGVLGVVWCGVVWCGVVWCGVVWCGVVWCGVVCLPCMRACVRACMCVTAALKSTGLLCPVDSVVFGLFQICDSIKSRPTINICNISINMIRQNNYVSAACYWTKYSLLFQ